MNISAELENPSDVGVFIHGRNLDAPDLDRMLWGFGAVSFEGIGTGGINNRMGTIPTAVMTILDIGPEKVKLGIGSGASSQEGLDGEKEIEADYIKRQAADFETLEKFPQIRFHPGWRDEDSRQLLMTAIENAHTDTNAQNTKQEVVNAVRYFGERGIDRIVEVTGMSHAVRCLVDRTNALMDLSLQADRDYYPEQVWTLVSDNEPYPTHYLSQPVYVEPPHRGDLLSGLPENLWLNNLLQESFGLSVAGKVRLAIGMRKLIDLGDARLEDFPSLRRAEIWLPRADS